MIEAHFSKNNLHHAYLIEGEREKIFSKILEILEKMEIKTLGNPDFCHISIDTFKIEEAFYLRQLAQEKAFSEQKKIFVISTNSISRDAQGVLLKIFEEPIAGTHFFLILPEALSIFPTLRSRFYFISTSFDSPLEKEADNFLQMSQTARISFLKEFLKEEDDSLADSTRAKALKFLNILEKKVAQKIPLIETSFLEHFFKVREYLRQPGSSVKNLMESLALIIPVG